MPNYVFINSQNVFINSYETFIKKTFSSLRVGINNVTYEQNFFIEFYSIKWHSEHL